MFSPFTVHIPATTANLGSGFDCLGLALSLENEVTVSPADHLEIQITGEGADTLPRHAGNRVVRAMRQACDALQKPLPPLRLRMLNRIPLTRGLGSSAAAAVGGLLAANHIYGDALQSGDLLALATEIEGHPDNVAPALNGGMCVVNSSDGKLIAVRIEWPDALKCILYVPTAPLATAKARAVLPETVSRADAVFNTGRSALWVAALTQMRFDLIRLATEDRLHQPYRAPLIVGYDAIVAAALQAGALGAFLSGAGSSIAAIAAAGLQQIAQAMEHAGAASGQRGKVLTLDGSRIGAIIRES